MVEQKPTETRKVEQKPTETRKGRTSLSTALRVCGKRTHLPVGTEQQQQQQQHFS
jgi:hypothetical protein